MRNSVIKKNRKVYIFKHQQTSSGGGGGGADLEDNKTATIDVSTYTEPVEITPTAGKDGMKKSTVTLSNIPSGGVSKLYYWNNTETEHGFGYTLTENPQVGDTIYIYDSMFEEGSEVRRLFIKQIAVRNYNPETHVNYVTVAYDSDPYGIYLDRDSSGDITF